MSSRPKKRPTTPDTRDWRVPPPVAIRAAVTNTRTGETVHGWVRNVSVGGMYVVEPRSCFPPETPVMVLAVIRRGQSIHRLRTQAWVAHTSDGGMGIQFDALDPETTWLLQNLVTSQLASALGLP
jgi:hypothetical protein